VLAGRPDVQLGRLTCGRDRNLLTTCGAEGQQGRDGEDGEGFEEGPYTHAARIGNSVGAGCRCLVRRATDLPKRRDGFSKESLIPLADLLQVVGNLGEVDRSHRVSVGEFGTDGCWNSQPAQFGVCVAGCII